MPLEVYVKGDKGPIYGTTFDDDGRGGYAAQLPFNAYGALGMAREEYNMDSASSQARRCFPPPPPPPMTAPLLLLLDCRAAALSPPGLRPPHRAAAAASSQFFWLLFDSDLTPAGKNLLDGRYSCFGYTVDGAAAACTEKDRPPCPRTAPHLPPWTIRRRLGARLRTPSRRLSSVGGWPWPQQPASGRRRDDEPPPLSPPGARFLSDLKEGDIIESAKVVEGLENLIQPARAAAAEPAAEGA